MSELKKCPSPAMLEKLLDGLINADQEAALTRHLDACEGCREVLDGLGSLDSINTQLRPDESQLFRSRLDKIRSNPPNGSPSLNSGYVDVLPWLEHSETAIGKIAEFKLVRFIGRGGMGLVFEAFDEKLQREVAIKLMSPGLLADSHASERFLREARSAAQINHVNVVTIHGVDQIRGLPWLVMELIDGRSLDEQLRMSGQLPVREILKVAQQTALGLQAAHQRGITHRDIKPSNLMLDRNSKRIKIADFGLASSLNETSFTRSGMLVGTPDFASPEQVNSQSVDARSDLFSLGSVLYLLCTNSLPFSQDSLIGTLDAVRNESLQLVSAVNKQIPHGLAKIVQRLMEKDPDNRYQSADDLLAAINQFAKTKNQKTGGVTRQPVSTESEAPWLWPVLVALGVFGLVATFATAWFNWPQGPEEKVASTNGAGKEKSETDLPTPLKSSTETEKPHQADEQDLAAKKTDSGEQIKQDPGNDSSESQEAAELPTLEPAVADSHPPKDDSIATAENPSDQDSDSVEPDSERVLTIENSEQLMEALLSNDVSTIKLAPGGVYRIERSIEIEGRDLAIVGNTEDKPRIEIATEAGQPSIFLEDGVLDLVGVVVESDAEIESEEPLIHVEEGALNIDQAIVRSHVEGPAVEIFNSDLTITESLLLASEVLFGVEPKRNQKIDVQNSVLVAITNFELGGSTLLRLEAEGSQFLNQQMFVVFEDNHGQFEARFTTSRCTFGSGDALFGFEADSAEAKDIINREFAGRVKWSGLECVLPRNLVHTEYEEKQFALSWEKSRVKLDPDSRISENDPGVIDDLIDAVHELDNNSFADARKLIEREIR